MFETELFHLFVSWLKEKREYMLIFAKVNRYSSIEFRQISNYFAENECHEQISNILAFVHVKFLFLKLSEIAKNFKKMPPKWHFFFSSLKGEFSIELISLLFIISTANNWWIVLLLFTKCFEVFHAKL